MRAKDKEERVITLACPFCGYSWRIPMIEWEAFKFMPDCVSCGKRGMLRK